MKKIVLHDAFVDFKKGLAGAPPEEIAAARDTATNPAVLTAFALAIIAGGKFHLFIQVFPTMNLISKRLLTETRR